MTPGGDLAVPQQNASDVGGRNEIPTRAYGTISRNDRRNIMIEEIDQPFNDNRPHGGVTFGQGICPKKNGRPDGIVRQGVSGAADQKVKDVFLMCCEIL